MNKQLIFKKRPVGVADKDTWSLETNKIPTLKDGEVLIEHHYISLDPAMRGWMNETKSYIPPIPIDDVMRAGSIGKVVKTNNHSNFKVGDCVTGWGGVQQFVVTNGDNWYKVDDTLAPMPMYIGTLGMPGMTAYFGILNVAKIKAGDIVLVSGAAGAVGHEVGRLLVQVRHRLHLLGPVHRGLLQRQHSSGTSSSVGGSWLAAAPEISRRKVSIFRGRGCGQRVGCRMVTSSH